MNAHDSRILVGSNSERANLARIELLAKDARQKVLEWEVKAAHRHGRAKDEANVNRRYYEGVQAGLFRALNVLEGRG